MEALLGAGGDANQQDGNGWTALHYAVSTKTRHTLDMLGVVLQTDVNVLQVNNEGMTALMLAASKDIKLDLISAIIHRDPTQLSVSQQAS